MFTKGVAWNDVPSVRRNWRPARVSACIVGGFNRPGKPPPRRRLRLPPDPWASAAPSVGQKHKQGTASASPAGVRSVLLWLRLEWEQARLSGTSQPPAAPKDAEADLPTIA